MSGGYCGLSLRPNPLPHKYRHPLPFPSGRENTIWVLNLPSMPLVRGDWDGGGVTDGVLTVCRTMEVSCI
jgi:hypothetical protein